VKPPDSNDTLLAVWDHCGPRIRSFRLHNRMSRLAIFTTYRLVPLVFDLGDRKVCAFKVVAGTKSGGVQADSGPDQSCTGSAVRLDFLAACTQYASHFR